MLQDQENVRYMKTPSNSEQTLAVHLVKLGRVVHMDLERDARVLSLFARRAFEDVIVPLGQAPSHGFSDVGHEALVVNSDDLEVKTARVLPNVEDGEHARQSQSHRVDVYQYYSVWWFVRQRLAGSTIEPI